MWTSALRAVIFTLQQKKIIHQTVKRIAMTEKNQKPNRRDFLSFLSFGIFAGIAGTIAVSAFRFLRPTAKAITEEKWIDVAPVAELKGDKPLMQSLMVEKSSGLSVRAEEEFVFVLPNKSNQVLSTVCPHEGCQVVWRDESNQFVCPCHDSFFNADGSYLSGPSPRGLDPLPAQEKNGVLQVQYISYENNTTDRIKRG